MKKVKYYKAVLWKAYFDKGYSLTSYIKWIAAVAAIKIPSTKVVAALAFIYGLGCLVIGRVWFALKLVDAEHEVQNTVNPFVREMREKFK